LIALSVGLDEVDIATTCAVGIGVPCYNITAVGRLLDEISPVVTTSPENPVPHLVGPRIGFDKIGISTTAVRKGVPCYDVTTIGSLLN